LKQHLEHLITDNHRLRKPGEAPPVPLPDIRDISYTLQTGRAHFDERLMVLASSCAEAVEKLGAFLDGHKSADVFAGSAKSGGAIADVLKEGEESREFVKRLAAGRALSKLSRLWVGGVPVDWSVLHDGQRYRVPLPAYPFARERHWLSYVPEANSERLHIEQLSPEPPKEEKEYTVLSSEPFVASGSDELDIVELIRPYNAHPAARATGWQTNAGACFGGSSYEAYLTELVASELKLAPERVDPTEPVLNYGVDSLVLMKLRNNMEERFGELPVMLFFEYKTIRELSEYLATTQPVTNAYTDDIRNFTSQGAD
jgi:acyl transferase domain-containing protein